ncbi:MAG: hypothetical protein SVX43_03450, partial [Cyanobacteriota bacterium]|nr:hypothetical protein [Cyanobacteriota bacterium]
MMMTTHTLPPGSLGHLLLGEMADFVCDPITFVWERYRKYGRIFKTRLVRQPRIFLIGPEANKLVLYDRADWFSVGAPIRHTRGAFYSDEALTLNDGESFRRLKSSIAPTLNFDAPEGRYIGGWPPKRDRAEMIREYKHKSAARDALHEHLHQLIRDRRQTPRQDAISTLMA